MGGEVSLRWIYTHMATDYARHCGHADLIRERIDGTSGVRGVEPAKGAVMEHYSPI